MPDRIRSALILDFDNIFISLRNSDRDAALYFAKNPSKLLKHLETWGLNDGQARDFIYKRVYADTDGDVRYESFLFYRGDYDFIDDDPRIADRFLTFAPYFIRSGFRLVDCPALTGRGKNAADIQMVVDVLTNLEGRIDYDELVIMSGDSDFAPLLRYVRSNGKRTMIVSAGHTAGGYRKTAHSHLPFEQLTDLIKADMRPNILADNSTTVTIDREKDSNPVLLEIERRLAQSGEPICLTSLGNDEDFSRLNLDGLWNGYGAITGFVRAAIQQAGATHLLVEGGWVWDSTTHTRPQPRHLARVEDPRTENRDVTLEAMKIARLPIINREDWAHVFEIFSEYAVERTSGKFSDKANRDGIQFFTLSHCIEWVRNELMENDIHISRKTAEATFYAILSGDNKGIKPTDWPSKDSKDKMRDAIVGCVRRLFRKQSIVLSGDEEKQLRAWLGQSSSSIMPKV